MLCVSDRNEVIPCQMKVRSCLFAYLGSCFSLSCLILIPLFSFVISPFLYFLPILSLLLHLLSPFPYLLFLMFHAPPIFSTLFLYHLQGLLPVSLPPSSLSFYLFQPLSFFLLFHTLIQCKVTRCIYRNVYHVRVHPY